jgi:hypothetical protein
MLPTMKPAGRWLLNFAAAVSLVCFVAIGIVWIASYNGGYRFSSSSYYYEIWSDHGWLRLYNIAPQVSASPTTVRAGSVRVPTFIAKQLIHIPHGLVMLVLLIAPVITLRAHQLRKQEALRKTKHLCVNCGYDLRATPDRCPECGAIPSPTKPAPT